MYISPEKSYESDFGDFNQDYPLPFNVKGLTPIVKCVSSEKIATITYPYTLYNETKFASIHSNPPGIATEKPEITVNNYGKGKVIWSAFSIESIEHPEYGKVLFNILKRISKYESKIQTNAPANIEITVFEAENDITVNTVMLNNESYEIAVYPFDISVKCDRKPSGVLLLPVNKPVDFSYEDGCVTFKTKKLLTFDMYQINF